MKSLNVPDFHPDISKTNPKYMQTITQTNPDGNLIKQKTSVISRKQFQEDHKNDDLVSGKKSPKESRFAQLYEDSNYRELKK